MPIEAPISELGLFELFQLISLTDKRGTLSLTDYESKKNYTIYFKDGKLAYIDLTDRLKEEMQRRDLVGREEISSLKGEGFIDYIIEKQVMTGNTFKVLFKKIVEEVIYPLFLIKSGYFSFEESDFSVPDSLELEMKIENIILEAARRMDEMSKMEEVIPSRDILLEVSSEIIEMEQINLDRMEWRILSLIDGKRTITDLIAEIGDEFAVLKSLYGMIMTGIITEKRIAVDDILREAREEEDEVEMKLKELTGVWNRREYEKGIQILSELKSRYSDDPRIIYELGYYYLASGKFMEAISEWNSCLLLSKEEKRKKEIKENLDLVTELQKKIFNREVSR